MNVCMRRLIHSKVISHARISSLRRGMLTCHDGVRRGLSPVLAHQEKQIGFMDISEKQNDLSIKNSIVRNRITDPVVIPKGDIEIPISLIIRDFELPTSNNKEMIDPTENVIEKKAHRMIRIRKKKMKKHKWKKRQKKMKFVFAKVKRKRKAKKEAAFKEELRVIVQAGESYDAEKELMEKLDILKWEKPINRVGRSFCPKWVVDEHLEREKKKKAMEDRVSHCLTKLAKM